MRTRVLLTPFHESLAARNTANAWLERGAYSVPAHFGDAHQEALAAHRSAALFDISYTEDLSVQGAGAAALISRACGESVSRLTAGRSAQVQWRADGGGLRGAGTVSCLADGHYLLRAADCDIGWFAGAAPRFGVSLAELGRGRGLLFLTGPFAIAVLVAAGLEVADLEPLSHTAKSWRGLALRIFRTLRPAGYELFCAGPDAPELIDRLDRAGRMLGLKFAGEEALGVLQLEVGLGLAFTDFLAARDPLAAAPALDLLGEAATIPLVLTGIALESDQPMPFAPVFQHGKEIGRTFRSLYSPAWRGAIALAELPRAHAQAGTAVTVGTGTKGQVVKLPFLG